VAQIGTLLSPRATLQRLQAIEEGMGRVRRERWGSREIDLDLLLYAGRVVEETGLQIPHPLLEAARSPWCRWPRSRPALCSHVLRSPALQLRDRLPADQLAGVLPYRPIRRPLPEPESDDEPAAP